MTKTTPADASSAQRPKLKTATSTHRNFKLTPYIGSSINMEYRPPVSISKKDAGEVYASSVSPHRRRESTQV